MDQYANSERKLNYEYLRLGMEWCTICRSDMDWEWGK
jgi:hypothetical protein